MPILDGKLIFPGFSGRFAVGLTADPQFREELTIWRENGA